MTLSPYSFEGQRSNRCWPGPWGLGAALTFVLTGVWRGCGRSGPRPDLRVCRQRQGQGEAGHSLSKIAFVVVWFELSDTRNTGSWDRVSGKKKAGLHETPPGLRGCVRCRAGSPWGWREVVLRRQPGPWERVAAQAPVRHPPGPERAEGGGIAAGGAERGTRFDFLL